MRAFRFIPAVAFVFASVAAHADAMPHRKPGLWDVTMTMQGVSMPPRVMQMCIDASTDAAMMNMRHGAQAACDKPVPHVAGDVTTVDTKCTIGGSHQTNHIVFTREGDDAYKMEIHTHSEPPLHGMADNVMVQNAKWMGPCKPGMTGGDMIMPGGMKINILHGRGTPPH